MLASRNWRFLLVGAVLCLAVGSAVVAAVHSDAKTTALRTAESVARDAADAAAAGSGASAIVSSGEEGYSVTMSPVGTVHFRRPPERIVTGDANYNDMVITVGRGPKVIAAGYPDNHYEGFYAQLPGFEPGLDFAAVEYLHGRGGSGGAGGAGLDKERLYALRGDIFHIDPTGGRSWTRADIEEITRNLGPFFANRGSRENSHAGDEPYEFYDLWQLAEKVAQVYRRPDRVAKLKAIADDLVARIQQELPPLHERPTVGLVYYSTGRITPYSMGNGGFGQAQYAAVGARDAFEGRGIKTYGSGGGRGEALDLEGLLAIDPDVLIMPLAIYGAPGSGRGARSAYENLLKLAQDPLGQRLRAFQSGQVHPGGTPFQGPIFFIFQVEMAAKQIYPALFGPYRDDQGYPPAEQLFDRAAVAAVLADAP